MTWLFVKCFSILLVLAVTLAGGPLLAALGTVALAGLVALVLALHLVRLPFVLLLLILVGVASILVGALEVITALPARIWNWMATFDRAEDWHIEPVSLAPLERPAGLLPPDTRRLALAMGEHRVMDMADLDPRAQGGRD